MSFAIPTENMLVTMTIGIDKDGNIYQDTQTHGNAWGDVYRGVHSIKAEVDRLIAERRECPFNPKNVRLNKPDRSS